MTVTPSLYSKCRATRGRPRLNRTTCKLCEQPLDGKHPSYCKACFAAYMRERNKRNPELQKEAARRYEANHPGLRAERLRERWASDPGFWRGYHQKWRRDNIASRKATRRKQSLKLYDLTVEDFEMLWDAQKGRCLVCDTDMLRTHRDSRSAVVDHDHETGVVRALLCNNCNRAIGLLGDDSDRMIAAGMYVLAWNESISEELMAQKEK
jgi:hypothetical protein